MSPDRIYVRSLPSDPDAVGVLTDTLDTVNGSTQSDPKPIVERVKLGIGDDANYGDITTANPIPVLPVGEANRVSKGYRQASSTAAAAFLVGSGAGHLVTLPAGATKVLIRPAADIRMRDDGTDPTSSVGYPVPAFSEFFYDLGLLTALKVYGSAIIDCWFF